MQRWSKILFAFHLGAGCEASLDVHAALRVASN
jgi:hypothetical protein